MELEHKDTINPSEISVRDFEISDLVHVLNYWYRSPPGYLEALGVDLSKMPSEAEMKSQLTARLEANQKLQISKLNALAIVYRNEPIGFHTLVPVKAGESGVFHAHIWQPNMRRKGIAFHSYPKACRLFMERFDLKKIIFKTPAQNTGALKVKEKLGIRRIGEEVIGFDIIKEGTIGIIFELTREELFQSS